MYIDLLVLYQIELSPKYGYEIKKNIQNQLGDLVDVNHNLLYPSLRRFEEKGAIFKKTDEQAGKPNRHVYYITDMGRILLCDIIKDFHPKNAKNDIEFLIRVALFDRIERVDRFHILNMRKSYLTSLLAKRSPADYPIEKNIYTYEVIQFSTIRLQQEIKWIDNLLSKI
ncbi:PadR family transcriptional regulator [Shimazuella sp. AN120528]|uniref:PadR family transcriptional regulator n=1 Tax=Shimazuella soli TaxID=1892854 RepID=UPI001F1118FE|nr:PadR family transcriptional regulator [Shimazuella soli]MCH5583762.1 PadR family transcriptional regulator [Shimazuella soli]